VKQERLPGSRRTIDWEVMQEAARALPETSRAVVGDTWRERMRQEHLAVGAFAVLTQELAAVGCDGVVLELIARASSDEVRHAEICGRMATTLLGDGRVPRAWRGLPNLPRQPGADVATQALLHVVEMCCLSETLTGVFFTEMHARATAPARGVIESLLEDEIDHGRVGWAYLAVRAQASSLDGLSRALPAMLDRTFGRVLRGTERVEDNDAMEAFGYVRERARASIFRRALREVVVPGFELLQVDLSPSREVLGDLLAD
jgi:hypothetical protein